MPKVTEEYIAKKKKEIIDAAYQVCLEKPITDIVLQDITDKTGFSHGVIYKYYKDIDEVIHDLVASINSDFSYVDKWEKICKGSKDWKTVVRKTCQMGSELLLKMDIGTLKISAYADVLAMSDPDRIVSLEASLKDEEKSPFIALLRSIKDYLDELIGNGVIHPSVTSDEILQYLYASVRGIQQVYLINECTGGRVFNKSYDAGKMFDMLSDSLIGIIGG